MTLLHPIEQEIPAVSFKPPKRGSRTIFIVPSEELSHVRPIKLQLGKRADDSVRSVEALLDARTDQGDSHRVHVRLASEAGLQLAQTPEDSVDLVCWNVVSPRRLFVVHLHTSEKMLAPCPPPAISGQGDERQAVAPILSLAAPASTAAIKVSSAKWLYRAVDATLAWPSSLPTVASPTPLLISAEAAEWRRS